MRRVPGNSAMPLLAALALACACGCRTSYMEAVAARQDAMYGTGQTAMARAAGMAASTVNRKLGNLEVARLKMLSGDFAGSSAVLGPQMEELFDDTNEGPVIKQGAVAGNILAGTVGDDRAIPYEIPAFELLFGLQYQALNSLYLGRRDDARVYLRRATTAQEQLKERSMEGAAGDDESAENAKNATAAADQISGKLSAVANAVRASYENSLAWYLMGLFLEKEGDASNAAIAYREAAEICPAVRPFAGPPAGSGEDVVLVYEEGLVDMKEPIKIPLPFGGTIWSVDFPVYNAPPAPPAQIAVEIGGVVAATCVPVVNVQALAYRDLRDRIPGIATRNVTRAAVKIAAQQVANHVSTGSGAADVAIMASVFAVNAISTAVTEADTRAWQTIPEHVHLARFRLPAGRDSVVVRNALTGLACEVKIPAGGGGTRVVWLSDVRGYATVGLIPLGGGAASWARTTSLLGRR